ncbi:MAG: PA0069 family radical SAM protein [Phycisphaerae bacterium]
MANPESHGRGTPDRPPNRFEASRYEAADDVEADPLPQTELIPDKSQTVISRNSSPDLGFEFGLNPYRGCEHGCVYCYARPTHETLGMNCGIDFESKIMVKYDAATLLRRELSRPSWKGGRISMSTVTDCYQPIERKLGITRACLAVMAEFRQAVTIVTKNHLVTRDVDLLAHLAQYQAVVVCISITTLRPELSAAMEPRTSVPRRRLDAITALRRAGIEVGTLLAPVIPGLNDTEIADMVRAAADAGAGFAHTTPIRLPWQVKDMFQHWLSRHMPDRAKKVLHRIADIRGGKLNDSQFFTRFKGSGIFADQMAQLFAAACRRANIAVRVPRPSEEHFLPPRGVQLELFGSGGP